MSTLFDATDVDTSAGFAYHRRQLTDQFVRQRDDERYELTAAGRVVAHELEAGTFTQSVDLDPIELDDGLCPDCAGSVSASVKPVTDEFPHPDEPADYDPAKTVCTCKLPTETRPLVGSHDYAVVGRDRDGGRSSVERRCVCGAVLVGFG